MKSFSIKKIKLHELEIPFTFSIDHNLKARKKTKSIILEVITEDQEKGYGEAAPRKYVTGESIPMIINLFKTKLETIDFPVFNSTKDINHWIKKITKIIPDAPSMYAALEIALLDIAGKLESVSIHKFFNAKESFEPTYSGIIPFLEGQKLEKILHLIKGFEFPHVKIKVGHDKDLERLALTRKILGNQVDIRVDANRAWTFEEAIQKIKSFQQFDISGVEEPLNINCIDQMVALSNNIDVPLILDESVCSIKQARFYADNISPEKVIFNLKISKVGGMKNASEIYHFAKLRNIECALGCHVGETAILSAAGRLFAQTHRLKYLEGSYASFFMENDISESPLQISQKGRGAQLNEPGLGIFINKENLKKYSVANFIISHDINFFNKKKEKQIKQNLLPFKVGFNEISVKELFKKYEAIGFLYEAKMELLKPFFTKITKNWEKLKTSKNQLLWVLSKEQKQSENFSSITVLKYYNRGLIAQHLVSSGNPFLSLEVMQAAQHTVVHCFDEEEINSSQNWFRPNNRYAYRIFASVVEKLGPEKAVLSNFQYLHVDTTFGTNSLKSGIMVHDILRPDPDLNQFLSQQKGAAFVIGEELDSDDILQLEIAKQYEKEGMLRSRRILKITDAKNGKVIACVIINRAPLGVNFSFLGNRCMLILNDQLTDQQREEMLPEIFESIKTSFADFDLGQIPVLTDEATSLVLQKYNAQHIREYMQCIWLRAGFRQWYEHIESFLSRIQERQRRKELTASKFNSRIAASINR